MTTQKNLRLQDDLIFEILKIAETYNTINSIFLVGSHSINEQTPFSDIDMGLLFTTEERVGRKEVFEEISKLHPTLSYLYLYDKEGLFLYTNGLRLDISFIKPTEFANRILLKVKILKDINNVVKKRFELTKELQNPVSKPKWNEQEGDFMDWFFWMFRQAYCYILQAELKEYKSFDKLASAQDSIRQIREKLMAMVVYVHGNNEYISKVDTSLAQKLALTYTTLNAKDMLKATKDLVFLYETIGKSYATKCNINFPKEKIDILNNLLIEFDYMYKELSTVS